MTDQRTSRLTVSDTALMRWLERSGALDAKAMKDLLAASLGRSWRAARAISQSEFIVLVDGLAFVIKDDTVVTVLDENSRHKGRPRNADAAQASQ